MATNLITQLNADALVNSPSKARSTMLMAEALVNGPAKARVTLFQVDVLRALTIAVDEPTGRRRRSVVC